MTSPHDQNTTIPRLLAEHARRRPTAPAVHRRVDGKWQALSWADYARAVEQVGKALLASGHAHGDAIAILSGSRFEWFAALLGAAEVGVVPAGVYHTSAPIEVAYVLGHCEARSIVVEDEAQLAKVVAMWSDLPKLERVVLLSGPAGDDARIIGWRDFLALGDGVPNSELDARRSKVDAQDTAALIYTSGTTGQPKGVMLSNRAVAYTAQALGTTLNTDQSDVLLSYLPLAHIAEQLVSVHIAVCRGYQVYICDDPLKLADDLRDVRPTVFFGVPRVWERFYSVLSARLAQAIGAKRAILEFARRAGRDASKARHEGRNVGLGLHTRLRLADRLVFAKLKAAMGFDRAHNFLTGAAPTPAPVADFFASLNMELLEVYGQTEGTACTTANTLSAMRRGSVGRPIPGMQVRIADDGEILFKGPAAMTGYLKNEAATARTVVDGWVHTGDLGQLDDAGFLSVVGRKRDIIITSSGKNIAPKAVEGHLAALDYVAQAVCIGDGQRFLVALLTLDPDRRAAFASVHGCELRDVAAHPTLLGELREAIARDVNSQLARVEQVRNFAVLDEPFSPQTGETTVTFKIKRDVVAKNYAREIDALYAQGQVL